MLMPMRGHHGHSKPSQGQQQVDVCAEAARLANRARKAGSALAPFPAVPATAVAGRRSTKRVRT